VTSQRLSRASEHLDSLVALRKRLAEQRLVETDRTTESYEFQRALLALAAGDTAQARAALQRSLLENAAFYPARLTLGELALAAGRGEEAVGELTSAAELVPEDGYIHFRLGVALLVAGRWPDAAAELTRASEMEPLFADVDLMLGLALDANGTPGAAAERFRRYLQRAPRHATAGIARAQRWLAEHP
jgi:tetratricopeptide (TPR) repeat protein